MRLAPTGDFRNQIENSFDHDYIKRQHSRVNSVNLLRWFFNKVDINGMDRLTHQRPTVYFANHKSHTDYVVAWKTFLDHGIPLPHFVAGTNLNHPYILGALGMDFRRHGTFFVDRDLLAKADQTVKNRYMASLKGVVRDNFVRGEDLFVFPEGGRAYDRDAEPCSKLKRPIFKILSRLPPESREIDVVCMAFDYDSRVEEPAFRLLKKLRGRRNYLERMEYYATDATPFILRPLLRAVGLPRSPAGCYVEVGTPHRLTDIIPSPNRSSWNDLTEHVRKEVSSLYNEIRHRRNS